MNKKRNQGAMSWKTEDRTSGERDGRWKMGMRGDRGWKVDKGWRMEGQSDKCCWLQNKEHGIDTQASQSLKGNQK